MSGLSKEYEREVLSKEYEWEVLGYYVHKDDKEVNALTAMVVIDTGSKKLTGYCGAEQHFEIDREYLEECRRISKGEYLLANQNFYTPPEYLEVDEHDC